MRRKYVSQADLNHKKYGAKWKLPKAKKFFKTILGTDKFVEAKPDGAGDTIFRFRNEFIWLEAYVGYGSKHIELRTVNPHETIGYYDFETFTLDHDRTWNERDRSWQATKQEVQYNFKEWLNGLAVHNPAMFNQEIQRIKEHDFEFPR